MYSVYGILFLIGVCMILAGIVGRIGTGTMAEIDANVASAIALMVTYAFLLLNFSSLSGLSNIFGSICGGIPYVAEIADYGSLKSVFINAPLKAASAFCDVVFLSTIINLLSLLPLTRGNAVGKFMVKLFTGISLSLIALVILNFVIKESGIYQYLVTLLGAVIAILTIGSIPVTIFCIIKNNKTEFIGLLAIILIFSKSKVMGILRDSFLKASIYVIGIYVLESHFGTIANSMSKLGIIVTAFGPVVIMLLGIIVMLKSVFRR